MINTATRLDEFQENSSSLSESSFNNASHEEELKNIQQEINTQQERQEHITQQDKERELKKELSWDNITKESIEAENRVTNNKIMIQKTDIFYQNKQIDNIQSLRDMITFWLQQKREPTKILQVLVESIHKKQARISVENENNVSFYCWDRALLIYQICEQYKDVLGIKSCNIALPYGHVMDMVNLNNGKTYIVDSSAWCFNEITGNFVEKRIGNWLTYTLKSNVKCFGDQPDSAMYAFTSFPMADKIEWKQFWYISSRIKWFEYYAIQKFYEAAQKTPWYEKTHTVEELKLFLEKEIYTKESPYDGILAPDDILTTFTKEEQIKMIEGQISKAKSKEENQKYAETYQSIIGEISTQYADYDLEKESETLDQYRNIDAMIFKAKLSENDVKRIIEVCKRSNISWDQLLKMCLDFISNPKDQNPIISWSENQELDKKFKEYLLARNAQANAWSSNIKKELEIQIKALKI